MFTIRISNSIDVINFFDPAINPHGGRSIIALLNTALGGGIAFKLVMIISTADQLFCITACLTSCSRMVFAFSRDGAAPKSPIWRKVNKIGLLDS